MRVFIDTNLWACRLDQREPAKSGRVRGWLADLVSDHEVVISTQVLIELRSVVSRKLQPPLGDQQITALMQALACFEVVGTDANLILDAHQLAIREQLSWFDALIAEAAIRSRCAILFSEDFSHGRRIGGLEVLNPLKGGDGTWVPPMAARRSCWPRRVNPGPV
jgi:predicted nucleic acid-binding protein